MSTNTLDRDYALGGKAEERAVRAGLAEAAWYRSPVDAAKLRELSQRSDGRSLGNAALYFSLLIASGVAVYASLWSWWTIPALFVYGTLYGSSADPRWHECGHRTAFKSDWLNDLVYYPASFMMLRDPTVWRWSHVRHHSDTIIVGRDPEIVLPRPPRLRAWIGGLFALPSGPRMMWRTVRHAAGRIGVAERSYVPDRELSKVRWEARAYVALWVAIIGSCFITKSGVPLLFFVGPSFYGAWLVHVFGTTQHLGLQENVLDHRLNSRTVYMNPVLRFLYWNMNYHCEHHMYPIVPSHALADLHAEIKDDLPEPKSSLIAAYKEIIPALRHQRVDPGWEIPRRIPETIVAANDHSSERMLRPHTTADTDWIDMCDVSDLTDGEVARADFADCTFAIYCIGSEYFATDGICTHSRRVHLAGGLIVDGQIECPKHNGRFDVKSGEPVRAPVDTPLRVHEVQVAGTRILVRQPRGDE